MRLPSPSHVLAFLCVLLPACGGGGGGGAGAGGAGAGGSGSSNAATSTSGSSGSTDPAQICVDHINTLRATLKLPPYARWSSGEACAGMEAQKDEASNSPHSAFGTCGEHAQDECPGWPGPPSQMITQCLDQMWAEGPGTDFSTHGHYINMSSTSYTEVACGYYTLPDGSVWAAQNFK
jgi:Cysteine-rich secretory protein family